MKWAKYKKLHKKKTSGRGPNATNNKEGKKKKRNRFKSTEQEARVREKRAGEQEIYK
ncbi:hypothetical protein [Companilactobacillus furfuricola]|uniref:hypothetical protein n=1 Tax=Companilactobacillus furfuricola TaxID=1462575 RepID=UPI0013DE335C|nr:hypothetical protein [Companilactobacillus furfuricola]